MSDIPTTDWSEIAANNIQPSPAGWPSLSSPNIVYSTDREMMGAIKREWNRGNAVVTSTGSANAQVLTFTSPPAAMVRGMRYAFIAGFQNTGATTLTISPLAPVAIQANGAPLSGAELKVGLIAECIFDGTNLQLIAGSGAGSGAYLPLAGGTLSGPLVVPPVFAIDGAAGTARSIQGRTSGSPRWSVQLGSGTAEGGSNGGSDLLIARNADNGSFIDFPLTITRASGLATFADNIALNGAAGTLRQIVAQTSGSPRWALNIAGAGAEGGSNAGSDLGIWRYTDAGTFIDAPLTITRSTGLVTLTGAPNALNFNNVVSFRQMTWSTSGSQRWSMGVNNTAEGGANAGSDFFIGNFADAGAGSPLAQPIQIKRSTGVTTFSVAIVNGPSDRTLKENIEPLDGALDKVKALQGVSFNMKTTPEKREIGLIAQDVEAIVPEIIQPFQNGEDKPKLALDYPKLTALLIEAVKSLTERIEKLEARLPLAPETA